jgi:TonB family protein
VLQRGKARKYLVQVAEDEGGALDSLRFSLAGEIVELVVLTDDPLFLQTLREAVGTARRVWHVPTSDKASDLLIAGQVGILVLDALTLKAEAARFVGQIKQQFPDLVVVAAGSREDETALAGLISAGMVYRFIHKPMSPGRARLFTDAAVKKFEDQRRRVATPALPARAAKLNRGWLLAGLAAAVVLILAAMWGLRGASPNTAVAPPAAPAEKPQPAQSPPPAQAPADAAVAEERERLLARAENALLEDRWDEASTAIEAARRAGVEAGRLSFLSAQLARSRERAKAAQAQALARAAKNDASAAPAQDPEQTLAARLLSEARDAIERRDFAMAAARLTAADGIAAPDAIQAVQQILDAARRQAETESLTQLLKNANERLAQDQLIQPENDNAKYYLLTLRARDPANGGLAAAVQDFGARVTAKARQALALEHFDAARSWLDEAAGVGYASAESAAVLQELETAVAGQKFLNNVVSASELTPLKTVQPKYPEKADRMRLQGWVELDFTVAEGGEVKDVAVHGASAAGVFDQAAIEALSQWRYRPVQRDGKPVAQRARIRIRFNPG